MVSSEPKPDWNRPTAFEQIWQDPVIPHAQRTHRYRSNENAARWARLECADTNGRKSGKGVTAEAKNISKD
jgi:hypothetical protein